MNRPKTDSERQYEAYKAEREEAEKIVQSAERITTGHPLKIETKSRQLRDLENTINWSNDEQNRKGNRYTKRTDLEQEINKLKAELAEAEKALPSARETAQSTREKEGSASAQFTIERDRRLLDNSDRKLELDEKKFALVEREKAETTQAKLDEARLKGASDKEIQMLEAKAKAAMIQFEWQQRFEMEAVQNENRTNEIILHGDIAQQASKLNHKQALEIIKANEISDIARIVATATEHRQNVTHEVNEDVRKALEMLPIQIQKGIAETLNTAKLLILKHYLRKDEMSHALKIGQQARRNEIENVAEDMAEISKWNKRQSPESDYDKNQN